MSPRLLLCSVALLVPLAGCASDDGGSTATDAGPDPKPAYVAAAGKVCSDAKAAAAGLKAPASAAELGAFVDASLALGTKAQTDLAALTPPPRDAAALTRKVLDPFARLIKDGEAYGAKVKAAGSDPAVLIPLLAERPKGGDIDVAFLRNYGLDTCADVIAKLQTG